MNKHVAAMLTMLIIPSAFAQTPLTDSKTIVIKPSALAVEMVPDIAYSFTQNIMGRPLQLTMDLLKPYADKPLPAVVFITGAAFSMRPNQNSSVSGSILPGPVTSSPALPIGSYPM